MRPALLLALTLTASTVLASPLGYTWLERGDTSHEALSHRIAAPSGFTRIPVQRGSFGAWLRDLPLEPAGTKVHLFDGTEKPRQDVHVAVVALDVGDRDLQQCADAVMRLRAEYDYARGLPIIFHPEPKKTTQTWKALFFDPRQPDPNRKRFTKYLVQLFAAAGSASLQGDLEKAPGPIEPGFVLIQGGYPGHAILVLDVVTDAAGKKKIMLGQSYMPAQQFHVLKAPDGSAWFDEGALDTKSGLKTPEWKPFTRKDVRRFP